MPRVCPRMPEMACYGLSDFLYCTTDHWLTAWNAQDCPPFSVVTQAARQVPTVFPLLVSARKSLDSPGRWPCDVMEVACILST